MQAVAKGKSKGKRGMTVQEAETIADRAACADVDRMVAGVAPSAVKGALTRAKREEMARASLAGQRGSEQPVPERFASEYRAAYEAAAWRHITELSKLVR